jgi:hypothetical protein
MVAARKHWTDRLNAEGRDPQLRRVFGDLDPLQPGFSLLAGETTAGDFPTLATRVFGPLIAHRQEVGR